jgi:hypothetical protein
MVNPVNWVNGRSWTCDAIGFTVNKGWRGHEGSEAWPCAHRSRASGHSGAQEPIGGGRKERGDHGGPFAGLTEARAAVWRPGDGDEVAVVEKLGGGGAQAQREGKGGGKGAVRNDGGCLL